MLPRYFDYIFVHLRQKARLRPEVSLKFLSTLGPNPARNPGQTYNSETDTKHLFLLIYRSCLLIATKFGSITFLKHEAHILLTALATKICFSSKPIQNIF